MSEKRFLMQARELHLSRYITPVADQYDSYQKGEWKTNRHNKDFKQSWNEHYDRMDDFLYEGIETVREQQNLKRHEINLMLIGPGFCPVGNEIHPKTLRILKELGSIVVVDFSIQVVRAAIENIRNGGKEGDVSSVVPSEKLFGMQYDISNGISSAWDFIVTEKLQTVQNEEDLHRVVEELSHISVGDLKNRVLGYLKMHSQRTGTFRTEDQTSSLPGGDNEYRRLRLCTVNEEGSDERPLPIHLASLQMILAGTTAPTEGKIWDRFLEVTSSDRVALPPCEATYEARRSLVKKVHQCVQGISLHCGRETVTHLVQENHFEGSSDVRVQAMTDTATEFDDPEYSERVDRLRTDELSDTLRTNGVKTAERKQAGIWKDQIGHQHHVDRLVFVKGNGH